MPDTVRAADTRRSTSMPVGVVVRRQPGVTRWAAWSWRPVAILPGAEAADWQILREDGEATEYHAATVPLTLYRGETEAYRVALSDTKPCVYVILRAAARGATMPWSVHLVTASPHEAALFETSGEEIVEKVPMPQGVAAWVGTWVASHHVEEPFVKRQRTGWTERRQDGIGDPRIAQASDVYRAPTGPRGEGGT
ncbi:DUF3305 domain-containing protein [Roseivivax sediminis]|uniref:Molybdopterin-guanine dinucleotide biosynthesis protein A n=1 Tax=Roseivivax sediminis TaxID=936889 RepID=A0A1I1SL40_9RHOB|nr:DUF3305 domain-containing protein [Roseivivax sediminis]SFD47177.1 Protein of unknown function [Roseivivax sediminis]